MRYILDASYALRSWKRMPYVLCRNGVFDPQSLSPRDFWLLSSCDGQTELTDSEALSRYIELGVVRPAYEGERLSSEQVYRDFGVPYFKNVSFSPTARCNYNCRHCFMAKDENKSAAQFSCEKCFSLLDQFADCGIGNIRFTGGEPLLHPNFLELALGAKERGMRVIEVLTNGALVTPELLDTLRNAGILPLIMISFDGVGRHDWMRGVKGAQEKALNAVRMCREAGFPVSIHLCVHRKNADVIEETARTLSALDVQVLRVIRTSESPRWMQTSEDANIPPDEYFAFVKRFLTYYIASDLKPMLEIWSMLRYFPSNRHVEWLTRDCKNEDRLRKQYVCGGARSTLELCADGHIFPCNIVSGAMRAYGYSTPSVMSRSVRDILLDDEWMKSAYPTLGELYDHDPECAKCVYNAKCHGGCRAIGFAVSGSMLGRDHMRCAFFQHGHYAEICEILSTGGVDFV